MTDSPNPASGPPPHGGVTGHDANPAQLERGLLCELLAEVGPDAPTECEGWTAADLTAHLLVREGRPDALLGLAAAPLAGHTERLRRRTKANVPFPEMIARLSQGPPRFSAFALPVVDKNANATEFFVHHEDVRRARDDWAPRDLPAALEELLWARLRMARFVLRKVPVEVTAVRPDGQTVRLSKGRGTAPRRVRVHGEVGELTLWSLGRTGVARVRFSGDDDAVKALTSTSWHL